MRRVAARGLLFAVVAGATVLAMVVTTTVVWLASAAAARAEDGTSTSLREAGSAGRWHALEDSVAIPVDVTAGGVAAATLGPAATPTRSWLIQITADAASATEVRTWGSDTARPTQPTLLAGAGTTSTTALIRTAGTDTLSVETDADARLTITPLGWFEDAPTPGSPAPGGTLAVTPYPVLDTRDGTGGTVAPGEPVRVSPAGLGGLPAHGVQAVWVQIGTEGAGAAGLAGAARSAGSGLSLAPLAEDGTIAIDVEGTPSRVRAAVVGWVAGQDASVAESTIEGGMIPLPSAMVRFTASAGGVRPDLAAAYAATAGYAVYAAASTRSGTIGSRDGVGIATPVAGTAASVVIARLGDDVRSDGAEIDSLTLLAVLPAAAASAPPAVQITAPAEGDTVQLGESGGRFEITGTVTGSLGVRSVQILRGDRYIGTADVRADGDGLSWTLRTSAPAGRHEVTARVETTGGAVASSSRSFTVVTPPSDDAVASPDVVVWGEAELTALTAVSADTLTATGRSALRVGQIIAAAATAGTPDGLLRRVTGIERTGDTTVIHTVQATLTDAVVQGHVDEDGIPLGESPDSPTLASGGGGGSGGIVAGARPAADRDSVTLAHTDVTGSFSLSYSQSTPAGETRSDYAVKGGVDLAVNGVTLSTSQKTKSTDESGHSADDTYDTAYTLGATVGFAIDMTATARLMIDIDVTWAWLVPRVALTQFESTLTVTRTQSVEVQAFGKVTKSITGKAQIDKSNVDLSDPANKKLAAFLGRIAGVIPTPVPIPWTLSFWLEPSFELSFSVEGKYAHRISETTVDTIGFRWQKDRLVPVSHSSQTRTATPPKTSVTLSAELTGALAIVGKLYEMIGLELGMQLKLAATASQTSHDPAPLYRTKGDVTLKAFVGARLEVLQHTLVTTRASFDVAKWSLWDSDGLPETDAANAVLTSDPDTRTSVGSGERGLVVVLDLSDSMAGERLAGAQESLRRVVDKQPVGSELGVWTYPYPSADACGPGGFAIPVQPIVGTAEIMSDIGSLRTSGQTPTGEALSAVAAELTAEGRTGATIVLISDGESNCSQPPCDVAKNLVSSGFDIHVESVGIATSQAGTDELTCIAGATGGGFTEIDDASQLVPLLEKLGQVELKLDVTAAPMTSAGSPERVEVTVSNTSSRDATDVRVTLTTTGGSLVPRIEPTGDIPVGNIPAGGAVTRTFTLVPPATDAVGDTSARVGVWSDQSGLVTADVSYRTEKGASIEPGPLLVGGGAVVLAARDDRLAAGRGDRVADAAALSGTVPDRVIVSTPVSTLGVDRFLADCVADGCAIDAPASQVMLTAAQRLDLSRRYVDLWQRANTPEQISARGGATAPVIVTAYPDVFGSSARLSCAHVDDEAVASLGHTLISLLNAALSSSADAAAASGAEVYFARDTATALPDNGTLCGTSSLVSVDAQARTFVFDDTAVRLADDALVRWSAGRARTEASPAAVTAAASAASARSGIAAPLEDATQALFAPPLTVRLDPGGAATATVKPGQRIHVAAAGFAPGKPVSVSLDSGATVLGTTFADGEGAIGYDVVIPADQSLGRTLVAATGESAQGALASATAQIGVGARVPVWVGVLALLAMVLLTAAAMTVIAGLRPRRATSPSTPTSPPRHRRTTR